jgi:RNA polymerase-binding transcription factor DksA
MATKKAQKKAAKPAKKAPAKKPIAKKAAKPAKKAVVKKPAPKKAAPKPVAKKAASVPKKVAKVSKPVAKKSAPPVVKKTVPAKKVSVPVKPSKTVEPVKKPAVTAPTRHEVKPAIKPLVKQAEKKGPPKPVVIPKTSTNKVVKYEPDFTKSVLDINNNNQEQSGPTMRYSDAELTEFRDLILKKLETAKKELAYLQGLITRKDESGDLDEGRYMTMEDGSMSMEREQLSQMASRQITFIDHLEKAMMRIENKTYGICRVTGKLIDKARLRAVPHATLSIEAKQMMNK